jgi:hypothetical protein
MRFNLLISLLLAPCSMLVAQQPSKAITANPTTGELLWPDKETFKLINGIASGMSNPMTAPGDLIVGGVGGAPARLGIGLPGYVLAVNLTADGLVWIPAPTGGGGGGTGTVTSFSAGTLSPLFTTSVATPTTTPALSFSLSSQSANRIFAGPVTGGAAAPTFRALVPADVPDLSGIYLTPGAAAAAYVPVTRTVNGHALSADVTVTKADVGLGNVDNTSDLAKPISTATQAALNGKMSNPMTAAGDLIVGGASGAPARQAIGTAGQVLAVNGTANGVVWIPAPSGGGGTVTSFSAGALAPLFTTAVATPTTTPALSFSLTNQAANLFFAGPASGAAAAPTMRALVLADVPDLSSIYLTPGAAAAAYVPVTRTVNGHALSADVTVTKADVGLGNVDNTSDLAKPISTATQTALNAKATAGPVTTSGLTMNTARLLGRTTAAAGAVEEITVSTGLSLASGVLTATGGSAITALTGDVTATGPGSVAATLATVNSTVGTFGSASLIPVVTVNAKGLVTSVTTIALSAGPAAAGTLTGTTLAANVVNASLNSITPTGGTLSVAGAVTATGAVTIGNGAAGTFAQIILNGGSNATFGSYIQFSRNTVAKAYIGPESGILATNSDNLTLYAPAGISTNIWANATLAGSFTSVGLTVTNSLSAGGNLSVAGDVSARSGGILLAGSSVNPYIQLTDTGGASYVEVSGGILRLVPRAGQSAAVTTNLTVAGQTQAFAFKATAGIGAPSANSVGLDQIGYGRIFSMGANTSTAGTFKIAVGSSDASIYAAVADFSSSGLAIAGNLSVTGSISKGSGTFRIAHPLAALNRTTYLVHSFIEGPKADLIYRGRTVLVNGKATVDIDKAVGMTKGTFVALAENPQVWIQNESGPAPVRGAVIGSTLTVESASGVGDFVSWLVIAERHDETIQAADWTDLKGKPVLEPIKVIDPVTGVERPENKTDRAEPIASPAKSVKPAPKKI